MNVIAIVLLVAASILATALLCGLLLVLIFEVSDYAHERRQDRDRRRFYSGDKR